MTHFNELLDAIGECVRGNLLVRPEGILAFTEMIECALAGQCGNLPADRVARTRQTLAAIRQAALSASPSGWRELRGLHVEFRRLAALLGPIPLPAPASRCWSPVGVLGTLALLRTQGPRCSAETRAILDSIVEDEDSSLAGVLGDLLQDEGHDAHSPLVRHLCEDPPHISGCWAIAALKALEDPRIDRRT